MSSASIDTSDTFYAINNDSMCDVDFSDPSRRHHLLATNWERLKNNTDSLTYNEIIRIYDAILASDSGIVSVILIGSVARGSHRSGSDIDIAVIYNKNVSTSIKEIGSSVRDVNIMSWSKSLFLKNYQRGSELFVWCIKYGLLLYDRGFCINLYQQPIYSVRKTEILSKRTFIHKLVSKIYDSLGMNDIAQAAKMTKIMSIQAARIVLIANDATPKSGPELRQQLQLVSSPFSNMYATESEIKEMERTELVVYVDKMFNYIERFIDDYFANLNLKKVVQNDK